MPIVKLDALLGQDAASNFLRGVVAGGRPANAYLFHGPAGRRQGHRGAGVRARAAVRAVAAPRAPRRPVRRRAGAAGLRRRRLRRVRGLRKSGALQHPDLKFLFPVSGEERELDDTIAETLAALRDDPLFVFQYEKAASIRLSMTRELLRELAFKPFEAARRVVVVRDADRMREDQYSALLKIARGAGRLDGLGAHHVAAGAPAGDHPLALPARALRARSPSRRSRRRSSHGRRRRARGAPAGGAGRRDRSARALAAARRDAARGSATRRSRCSSRRCAATPAGLWRAVQGFTRFGRAGRETLRRDDRVPPALAARPAARRGRRAARGSSCNRDREAEIRRQAATLDATEIRRRLMVLEEALRAIEGNVSADLALFSAPRASPAAGSARAPGRRTRPRAGITEIAPGRAGRRDGLKSRLGCAMLRADPISSAGRVSAAVHSRSGAFEARPRPPSPPRKRITFDSPAPSRRDGRRLPPP